MGSPDRPLHRSLIKTGTRLFLGRARAHVQDWFPGLSIDREAGKISYKGRVVSQLASVSILTAEALRELYIVGSGPSIRTCDLTRTEDGSAILLNGAISLIGDPIRRPFAIAIEDERFVWRHFALMRDKIKPHVPLLLSVAVIRAICESDAQWLDGRSIILIDDLRRPYGKRMRSADAIRALDFVRSSESGEQGFSLEPDKGVVQGGSVAVTAVQFALYCRPKTIGFLGIDISNADSPRFYERDGATAFSGIVRAEARILQHLVLARTVAGEQGVDMKNYSAVSALRTCSFGYDDRFALSVSSAS